MILFVFVMFCFQKKPAVLWLVHLQTTSFWTSELFGSSFRTVSEQDFAVFVSKRFRFGFSNGYPSAVASSFKGILLKKNFRLNNNFFRNANQTVPETLFGYREKGISWSFTIFSVVFFLWVKKGSGGRRRNLHLPCLAELRVKLTFFNSPLIFLETKCCPFLLFAYYLYIHSISFIYLYIKSHDPIWGNFFFPAIFLCLLYNQTHYFWISITLDSISSALFK